MEFGLAGVVLLELTIRGRVAFKANDVAIMNKTSIEDDEIIQEVFDLILKEEEVQSALYWVRRLSSEMDNLKKRVIEQLEEKGMIEVEPGTKFLIFKTKKFKVIEKEKEEIIKGHLKDIVNEREESCPRTLGFLSLIYSTGATTEIFTEKNWKNTCKILGLLLRITR